MSGIGQYRQIVTLDNPGTPAPDGDGGYVEQFAPLDPPAWHCSITAASARALEAIAAGTVLAQATHLVVGPYHPGITIETRLTLNGRRLNVLYVANRDERDIQTQLICAEVLT